MSLLRWLGLDAASRAQRRKVRQAARWWRESGRAAEVAALKREQACCDRA